MDSRNAYAFGGDDGPVKHLVFWYMYDNRENLLLVGFTIGIVTVLSNPEIIVFIILFLLCFIRGFKSSTVGDARTSSESDRRVDDARVGGHRLGRRGIHDIEHTQFFVLSLIFNSLYGLLHSRTGLIP